MPDARYGAPSGSLVARWMMKLTTKLSAMLGLRLEQKG